MVGSVYNANTDTYKPLYGRVNSERSNAFHRAGSRIEKSWARSATIAAYLDLQNAYNRQSEEGRTYNYNFTQSGVIPGLPIIPSLGVRGEIEDSHELQPHEDHHDQHNASRIRRRAPSLAIRARMRPRVRSRLADRNHTGGRRARRSNRGHPGAGHAQARRNRQRDVAHHLARGHAAASLDLRRMRLGPLVAGLRCTPGVVRGN